MKNHSKPITFRFKIVIIFTLVALLALSLQTVLFNYSSSKLISTQAEQTTLNSLQNMQDDIYTFIRSLENDIFKIYNHSNFINDLTDDTNIDAIRAEHSDIAYQMALSIFSPSQNINALYIYNIDDCLISSYRHATTPKYTYPEDIYNDPLENNAHIVKNYALSDNKITLVSSYYNKNRKKNMIRFVAKIYGENTTQKIGYIVCDVDQKGLLKTMNKYIYSNKQVVWLQPLGDYPILQIGDLSENDIQDYNNITSLISENIWSLETINADNDNVFFKIPQKRYNLVAFSLTPQFLLQENQKALSQHLIIIAIILIITFSLLSIIVSHMLTSSLTKMMETISHIQEGRTSLRLTSLKNDEFGKLGKEFNKMLDRIEDLMAHEYQAMLLLNDAKYKALQAQINPHFLYNTLDTMSSIATAQQCNEVSVLCQALSNQFRYSLNMKDSLSTIKEEFTHLKNYLYIVNVRMQNNLNITIDIDSSLYEELIPRISIQPLVENSVIHGLKNKDGNKNIHITVKTLGGNIIISVKDNGIGMNADKINTQLKNPALDALEKNNSIGLSNINSRVKLLFGKKYGVRVESVMEKGSTVFLKIPQTERKDLKYE